MQIYDLVLSILILYVCTRTFLFLILRRQYARALLFVCNTLLLMAGPFQDWKDDRDVLSNCVVTLDGIACRCSFLGIWGLLLMVASLWVKEFNFPRNTHLGLNRDEEPHDLKHLIAHPQSVRRLPSVKRCINRLCYWMACCRCVNAWLVLKFLLYGGCVLFLASYSQWDSHFLSFFWILCLPVVVRMLRESYEKASTWVFALLVGILGVSENVAAFAHWSEQDPGMGWQFYTLFFMVPVFYTVLVVLNDPPLGDVGLEQKTGCIRNRCLLAIGNATRCLFNLLIWGWDVPCFAREFSFNHNGGGAEEDEVVVDLRAVALARRETEQISKMAKEQHGGTEEEEKNVFSVDMDVRPEPSVHSQSQRQRVLGTAAPASDEYEPWKQGSASEVSLSRLPFSDEGLPGDDLETHHSHHDTSSCGEDGGDPSTGD